jgi:hypothetical protein
MIEWEDLTPLEYVTVSPEDEKVPPLLHDAVSKGNQLEDPPAGLLLLPWHVFSHTPVCEPSAFCHQNVSTLVVAAKIWAA